MYYLLSYNLEYHLETQLELFPVRLGLSIDIFVFCGTTCDICSIFFILRIRISHQKAFHKFSFV